MKIKTVCKLTGLSDRAVRFYIFEGLIAPHYTENYLGRKTFDFSDGDVSALKDIAVLRKFGFPIPDIKEMIANPQNILPIVRKLQEQKERIIAEETDLLNTLISIEDEPIYTISDLAAILSTPVENKSVPSEDNAPHFWKKFGKACLFIPFAFYPTLFLCIGFYYLFHDTVLNVAGNILFYIYTPLTLCLLAYFFIFNRKGKVLYVGCIITIAVYSVVGLILSVFAHTLLVEHYAGVQSRSLYTADTNEHALLPDLSECGDFVNLEYYRILQESYIFAWDSTCYIFSYTPEEYTLQRDGLESAYTFQTDAIIDRGEICEPTADVDGYTFRLLSPEAYDTYLDYPKYIIMIGYSDQNQEIAYIVYEDPDIDYISDLSGFIRDDCGWIHTNRGLLTE